MPKLWKGMGKKLRQQAERSRWKPSNRPKPKGLRSNSNCGTLLILLYGIAFTAFQSDLKSQESNERDAVAMEKIQYTSWEDIKIQVHSTLVVSPFEVIAKRALYGYETIRGPYRFTTTAFVTERGNSWVGQESDFYVETGSGVLGAQLSTAGRLKWSESLVELEQVPPANREVDQVIERFDAQVTLLQFLNSRNPRDRELTLKWTTDLRSIEGGNLFKDRSFFASGYRSSNSGDAKIVSVEVADGEVRLDIKNSVADRAGSVWIDIESRKVTKATEAGEQTFPN